MEINEDDIVEEKLSYGSRLKSLNEREYNNNIEIIEYEAISKQALEEQKKEKAALEKENIDLKLDEGESINIGPDTDIEPSSNISTYDVRILNTYMSITDIAEFG